MLVVAINLEVLFESLIRTFSLAVTIRMVVAGIQGHLPLPVMHIYRLPGKSYALLKHPC